MNPAGTQAQEDVLPLAHRFVDAEPQEIETLAKGEIHYRAKIMTRLTPFHVWLSCDSLHVYGYNRGPKFALVVAATATLPRKLSFPAIKVDSTAATRSLFSSNW